MKNIFFPATVIFFLVGCDQAFNSNGTYDERMVVYSILKMESDTQYVRLYSTYDPHVDNPLTHSVDTEITDATVSITDNTTTYYFHDTTIVRADTTTLYGKYLHTYVGYKFMPQPQKKYTLTINSPTKGALSATALMFLKGQISFTGSIYQTLAMPAFPTEDTAIIVRVQLDLTAPAYMVRFLLRYKQYVGNTWVVKTTEVPWYVSQGQSYDDYIPFYPTLLPRGFNRTGEKEGEEYASFSKEAYITTIRYLINSIGPSRLQFDGAYFSLSQIDQPVYSYYTITNQVSDKISIRLDQIDYSNVNGGYGLFGIMTNSESPLIKLPAEIEIPTE